MKGNGESTSPSPSTTGRKVAFTSSATNLDPGDADTVGDIYVKDLDTGDVTLVSTSDLGVKGNGESRIRDLSKRTARGLRFVGHEPRSR